MKSFVIALLCATVSVSAIRTAPAISQAAVDRAFTLKHLSQNGTNTTNATVASLTHTASEPKSNVTAEVVPLAWDAATLPACPSPERTMMDDGKTHVVKFPYVGATCKTAALAQQTEPVAYKNMEHCPDFNERMTLNDGQTKAIKYPAKGFNCNGEGPVLAQKKDVAYKDMEHCPDFNERMTLKDGQTKAIKYPTKGFNCNAEGPV